MLVVVCVDVRVLCVWVARREVSCKIDMLFSALPEPTLSISCTRTNLLDTLPDTHKHIPAALSFEEDSSPNKKTHKETVISVIIQICIAT